MTRQLPDLEAWAIFATVAEYGSFSRAAAELGLSNPTVSKAIGRLEARLGFALLSRTSRRLSLTGAGQAALERASRILSEGEAVEQEAAEQARAPRGRVRLSAPLSFGIAHLAPVLPGLLRAYPEIELDLALSDRKVDLVAEGYDLALRIGSLVDSSLLSRRLCSVRLLLVGAPGYFELHGTPKRPSDLLRHRVIGYTGGGGRNAWRFTHPEEGEETVQPPARLWTDNADVVMPVLLAGQALAVLPEFAVWQELRDGSLLAALPDWPIAALGLHLLMPPNPLRPARVQAVIDLLSRELVRAPWASEGIKIAPEEKTVFS
ncbi:LysR family transcriptional regulator [Acetobacteraceae bacterium KSS8]|uniref:LysR family transcriptional regulator n=1 Tax=Endosaccharibacter trunci TaxID=2812733 RepID=A0ABT1W681_9PROT|nr:LysR family transcriptional regulator [Acetobacteraceae bacterium KSS8]